MKLSRLLPIMLLAIGVLAGCGGKKTPSESSEPASQEESSEPGESESSEPIESESSDAGESESETESESESSEPEVVYTVAITNKEELQETWYLGEAARSVKLSITADGQPQNATTAVLNEELVLTSSDSEIVAVSAQSLSLGGEKTGKVTITATYHDVTDDVELTVEGEKHNILSLQAIREGIAAGTIKKDDEVEFKAFITGSMDLTGGDTGHAYAGVYAQDGEYAMLLYAGSGDGNIGTAWEKQGLQIGDAILVKGVLSPYEGLNEVKPTAVTKLTAAEAEELTAPTAVEVSAANWSAEGLAGQDGRLAHVTGLVFEEAVFESTNPADKKHTTVKAQFVKENGDGINVPVSVSYHLNQGIAGVKTFFDGLEPGDYFEADGFVSWSGQPQFALGYMNGKAPAECLKKLEGKAEPIRVDVTAAEATLEALTTLQLTAKVMPSMVSQDVTWSSTDATVATVDENGLVTGVAAGEAVIKATSKVKGTVEGTYALTVTAAPLVDPESVTLTAPESATGAAIGQTLQLSASVLPSGASQKVIYETSDASIATVSEAGLVTFVGDGPATITAFATKAGEKVAEVKAELALTTKVSLSTYAQLKAAATNSASSDLYQFRGVVLSRISSNNQMIVADADGAVQTYKTTDLEGYKAAIGDVVLLVGKIQNYYGVIEFTSVTPYHSAYAVNNAIGTGEPVLTTGAELNAIADLTNDQLSTATGKYIRLEDAKITKNSSGYYNVSKVGATDVVTNSYAIAGISLDAWEGKLLNVTGHVLTSNSSSKAVTIYINFIEESSNVIAPTAIALDQNELKLEAGKTAQLTATLSPEGATGAIEWLTSDDTVATVDGGLVTAVAPGNATITAKVDELTATCAVTVTESPYQSLYVLDTSLEANKGSNNNYATAEDITVGGITWSVQGNPTVQPWRIGGKNLTEEERVVYSKTPDPAAVAKIEITLGAITATLNGMKVVVASDAAFTSVVDEITVAGAAANKLHEVVPSTGTEWAAGVYFKLILTISAGTSNQYVQLSKVEAFALKAAAPEEHLIPWFTTGEGNAANHIEGAGIWAWIQYKELGFANYDEVFAIKEQVTCSYESDPATTVRLDTISDATDTYVRFYFVLQAAYNNGTLTVSLPAKDGTIYTGSLTFTAGVLTAVNGVAL